MGLTSTGRTGKKRVGGLCAKGVRDPGERIRAVFLHLEAACKGVVGGVNFDGQLLGFDDGRAAQVGIGTEAAPVVHEPVEHEQKDRRSDDTRDDQIAFEGREKDVGFCANKRVRENLFDGHVKDVAVLINDRHFPIRLPELIEGPGHRTRAGQARRDRVGEGQGEHESGAESEHHTDHEKPRKQLPVHASIVHENLAATQKRGREGLVADGR